MIKIHQDALIKELAMEMIFQAVRDLGCQDIVLILDAQQWLNGSDFPLWAEAAGIPFADPNEIMSSHGIEKLRAFDKTEVQYNH